MSPQVNGDVPHSASVEHFLGYPMVNDFISTVKNNPYGKKSLELGGSAYQTFAAPFVNMLSKPYQYAQPYVKKADDLGDKALSKLDEKLPIVKKPTDEVVNDVKTIVYFPIRIGQSGKEHVLNTYQTEYKKTDGNNPQAFVKACISTGLTIGTSVYMTVSSFIGSKKDEAKQTAESSRENN